jgi:hypothetical protein
MRWPRLVAVHQVRKAMIMTKDTERRREPVLVGSARVNTKGGPMGNKDEAIIGGRYYG